MLKQTNTADKYCADRREHSLTVGSTHGNPFLTNDSRVSTHNGVFNLPPLCRVAPRHLLKRARTSAAVEVHQWFTAAVTTLHYTSTASLAPPPFIMKCGVTASLQSSIAPRGVAYHDTIHNIQNATSPHQKIVYNIQIVTFPHQSCEQGVFSWYHQDPLSNTRSHTPRPRLLSTFPRSNKRRCGGPPKAHWSRYYTSTALPSHSMKCGVAAVLQSFIAPRGVVIAILQIATSLHQRREQGVFSWPHQDPQTLVSKHTQPHTPLTPVLYLPTSSLLALSGRRD